MSKVIKLFTNRGSLMAYAIISFFFTLGPEDIFKYGFISCDWSEEIIVVINRLIACAIILVFANIVYYIYLKNKTAVSIKEKNITISIEYGDILKIKQGKKVINFDECFSTTIGNKPGDIKPESICGQYLTLYPISDEEMNTLLHNANIQSIGVSKYKNTPKYESGVIAPNNDFLLMAFAPLDENGLGRMTYDQYLDCLDTLWQQIDMHHGTSDVYLPILGSQITRFEQELTQQELLDVMISSYRLSPYKMKAQYTLHIVCRKREGFSINDVWGIC